MAVGGEVITMHHAIGLDLGGSSAKVALVSAVGAILAEEQVPVPAAHEPERVMAPIAAAVDRLRAFAGDGQAPVGVGCGFSGYLDVARTRIELNNTRALDGFAIEPWLRARFGLPVAVDNDACAAALAETRLLPGARARRVMFVTVGSGIGVVLVEDGAIVRVMKGVTGDASHLIVQHGSAERCPAGCRGCLETVASARAIARYGDQAARGGRSPALARMLAERAAIDSLDVSRAAVAGDEAARDILALAGGWLGVGLASWACIYAPDLILLGGGVAAAADPWLGSAIATMRDSGVPLLVEGPAVERAQLGNRAGMIGAAFIGLQAAGFGAVG